MWTRNLIQVAKDNIQNIIVVNALVNPCDS
jgi:hypothetical protein